MATNDKFSHIQLCHRAAAPEGPFAPPYFSVFLEETLPRGLVNRQRVRVTGALALKENLIL